MSRRNKSSVPVPGSRLPIIMGVVWTATTALITLEFLTWIADGRIERLAARTVIVLVTVCLAALLSSTILKKERHFHSNLLAEMKKRAAAQQLCVEEATTREGFESELHKSQESMGLAIEAARIGFWDWDVIKDEQVWSETCRTLLGLSLESPANFQTLMSRVHPDDRVKMQAAIDGAIEKKTEYDLEFRVLWPDGSLHWQTARGRAFYDGNGRATRMIGIAMDIDERKRAEAQLRLQAAALEAAANSIVITNHNGEILWTNRAFSEMTGYTAEEARGKTPRLLSSGKHDASFYAKLWQAVTEGKVWRGEIINRRKNGSLYTEEMTITPVWSESGEITHFIAIKQDISERKRAEEALRQTEEKYRTIFEDALVGIYQSTADGRFLSVNPALANICGYDSPAQQITENRDVAQDWYVNPEQGEEFKRLMAAQGMVRNFEFQAHRKDGTKIWLLQNARTVRSAAGEIRYFEGTVHDVTERKLLEEQLRQSQKMEAVGRLAGGVAHDFNNALGVISGYSELLQIALPPDEKLRKHAEEIQKAGRRAASLTRQLLAFSRKQTIQPTVLDLNSIVADIEKMLRRLIGEDIELTIVRDPKLKNIKADRGQIEQVLMNLAVNARDAMPQGGRLLIETANIELDEIYLRQHSYAKAGSYVMLSVSDNGCGMDKELQSHIFEPFFTTKEPGKGTGLGLSTVYGIVKQSEGLISAYSEVGKGTTFRLYLPRVEAAVQLPGTETKLKADLRGTETILLVEDEESMRELTRGCLRSSGYNVLDARNGKEAIELAGRYNGTIHLLLTDVIMPGISGRELADNLLSSHSQIKVLFMSGYTHDLITQHGVLDAGTELLEKPFGVEVLLTKVRGVLDGKLARAAAGR